MQVPFTSKTQIVENNWIDYNGHMNVGYYTFAFDKAVDEFLEVELGIGPQFVKKSGQGSYALQTQYRYLKELMLNDEFRSSIFVVDYTLKRMHLMLEMKSLDGGLTFASCETVLVNVNLEKRRSCEYPPFVKTKLDELYQASAFLRHNIVTGHLIGLKKA